MRQCLRQATSGKVSNSIHGLYVEPRNLPEQKSYLTGPIKIQRPSHQRWHLIRRVNMFYKSLVKRHLHGHHTCSCHNIKTAMTLEMWMGCLTRKSHMSGQNCHFERSRFQIYHPLWLRCWWFSSFPLGKSREEKFILHQATKAQTGSTGIALLFL